MEVYFVLVEPLYPENVGSVARAIKTMGFTKLVLVNPCNYLSKEAKWLAHGSIDILEKALVYKTLPEALENIDFAIATTSKKRKTNFNYYLPNEIIEVIEKKNIAIKNIGILFGREDTGLKNDDLKLADILTTVPIKSSYPSINLAQTAMIYAYELSKLNLPNIELSNKNIEDFKYTLLKEKVAEILKIIEVKDNSNLYNRIFERIALTKAEDINLMLSFLNKSIEKFNN
jgi:tRNA/rRNA methyltransferase